MQPNSLSDIYLISQITREEILKNIPQTSENLEGYCGISSVILNRILNIGL